MPEHHPSRREFLERAGTACAAATLGGTSAADAPRPLVRKSIAEFVKDEKLLASFRAGVQKLRDLTPDNPFAWIFQANVHGRPLYPAYVYAQAAKSTDPGARLFRDDGGFTPDPRGSFSFSQCPHGNWWFLPWHRAYLYYFERILRWASGNPDLALPYWNYSDPKQRMLPRVFRDAEAGGKPNPLYLPDGVTFTDDQGKPQLFPLRDGNLNRGLGELTEEVTSLRALNVAAFTVSTPPAPANGSFASPRACDPTCVCGSGALESVPHNQVHNALGGAVTTVGGGFRVRLMGDVPTAARDPIFWLHHANLDRLWESWLKLGKDHLNPDEPEWLDRPFWFYDVGADSKPKLVKVLTRDLLSTQALGYTYDQLEKAPEIVAARVPAPAPLAGQPSRPLAAAPAAKGHGIQLKNTSAATVPVRLLEGVTPEQFRAASAPKAEEKGELVLSLEGIEFAQTPGVYYDVYLGLPPGASPSPRSPHYVGTLTFFGLRHSAGGHGHGGRAVPLTVKFAVPPALRKLIGEKKLDPRELAVTFVPQTGVKPVKEGAKFKAPAERTTVTVRRVRLFFLR